jgi:hypothetical protein
MANSEKKIVRGVRVEGETYTTGMEDQLETALTAEDATRLSEKGHLEGKWSGKAKAATKEPAKEK